MMSVWFGPLILLALAFCLTVPVLLLAAGLLARPTSAERAVATKLTTDTTQRDRGEGSGCAGRQTAAVVATVPGLPNVRSVPAVPTRALGP